MLFFYFNGKCHDIYALIIINAMPPAKLSNNGQTTLYYHCREATLSAVHLLILLIGFCQEMQKRRGYVQLAIR